jgi:hypothetical protein
MTTNFTRNKIESVGLYESLVFSGFILGRRFGNLSDKKELNEGLDRLSATDDIKLKGIYQYYRMVGGSLN